MVDKEAVDRTRKAFGDISKMSERVLGNISVGKKSGGSGNRFDGLSDVISGGKTKISTPKEVESMFGTRKGTEQLDKEVSLEASVISDLIERVGKIEDEMSEIKRILKKL